MSTGTSCVYWNHPHLLGPPASAGPTLGLLEPDTSSTGTTGVYWTHPRLLKPTATAGTSHIVYWNYWCLLEPLMSTERLFHSGGVSGLSSLPPKFAHKETEVQPDKSVSGQPSVWGHPFILSCFVTLGTQSQPWSENAHKSQVSKCQVGMGVWQTGAECLQPLFCSGLGLGSGEGAEGFLSTPFPSLPGSRFAVVTLFGKRLDICYQIDWQIDPSFSFIQMFWCHEDKGTEM